MPRLFLQPKELDLLISHLVKMRKLTTDLDFSISSEGYKSDCEYFESFANSETLQKISMNRRDLQILVNLLTTEIEKAETIAEANELVGRANYFALFLRG